MDQRGGGCVGTGARGKGGGAVLLISSRSRGVIERVMGGVAWVGRSPGPLCERVETLRRLADAELVHDLVEVVPVQSYRINVL